MGRSRVEVVKAKRGDGSHGITADLVIRLQTTDNGIPDLERVE